MVGAVDVFSGFQAAEDAQKFAWRLKKYAGLWWGLTSHTIVTLNLSPRPYTQAVILAA